MPAKFTSAIREFIASSLISSVESQRTYEWVSGFGYSVGNKVTSNGNSYVASSSGTSGGTAPSHISGSASDGGVTWIYVGNAISDRLFEGNLYLGIGKQTDWTTPGSPDPVVAIDEVESAAMANLISLKAIKPSNLKACANRTNWETGTVYDQYDSNNELGDYTHPFYIFTADNRIYKCLDNFNGATSTSMPTGVLTVPFRTADGYVWKYMGNADAADAAIFMTADFLPVSVKKNISQGAEQWAVQLAAQPNGISTFKIIDSKGTFSATPIANIVGNVGSSGAVASTHKTGVALDQVYITDPGTGYNDTTYARITDGVVAGTGAVATATINGTTGAITGITISNGGSGYTAAVAFLVGVPKPGQTITAPTNVTVNVSGGSVTGITLTGSTLNYQSVDIYIVPGSSGAIAFPVLTPTSGHGANIVRELNASTVMISVKLTNTVADTGYYLVDTGSEFHQVSVITDIVDFTTNKWAAENLYIGPSHPDYSSPGALKKIKSGVGVMLYINNIPTVVRTTSQEEDIKVAITL